MSLLDLGMMILGLGLTLVVVVGIHELGHYLVGRWCGLAPTAFALGFGRVLLRHRDRRGTAWELRALPLGGFVTFAGDAGPTSLPRPQRIALPGSLAAASPGVVIAVALAGPLVNMVLALAAFTGAQMLQPRPVSPWQIERLAPGAETGALMAGDVILSIGGCEVTGGSLAALRGCLRASAPLEYRIEREGLTAMLSGPHPFEPRLRWVAPGSPAELSGLQAGDLLMAVDGQPLVTWTQLQSAIAASSGEALDLDLLRGGETRRITVMPSRAPGGAFRIGVDQAPPFSLVEVRPGLVAATASGLDQMARFVGQAVGGMARVLVGSGDACKLSGPVGIAQIAGQAFAIGLPAVLLFIGVISTGLALFNLLPIPGLDGGHVVLTLLEAVTGRSPARAVQAALFVLGVTSMIYLGLLATLSDALC